MYFLNILNRPTSEADDEAAPPVPEQQISSRFGWADPRARSAPPPAPPEPQYSVDPESGEVRELVGNRWHIVSPERLTTNPDTGAGLVFNGKDWQELPTPSSGSDLIDFGKNTVTGVAKGVGATVSLPKTAIDFTRDAVNAQTAALNNPDTPEATKAAIVAVNLLMTGQSTLPRFPQKLPLEDWLPTRAGMNRRLFDGGKGWLPYYVPHTPEGRLYQAGVEGATSGAIGGPEGALLGGLSLAGGQGLKEAGAPPGIQYAAELLLPLLAHHMIPGASKVSAIDTPAAAPEAGLATTPLTPAATDGITLASRETGMFSPPKEAPRPFPADYPNGAQANATGQLLFDMEGRPLTAPMIVGRNTLGGRNLLLPQHEFDPLTIEGTGRPVVLSSPADMQGDLGRTWIGSDGKPDKIELRNDLSADDRLMVHAHELGHMIDDTVGKIPTDGVEDELRFLYNDLNNPKLAKARELAGGAAIDPNSHHDFTRFGPEQKNYAPEDVARELWAEAFRAYATAPDYIKTWAPKVAARLRAWVNPNPAVNRFIQLNSLAPLLLLGGMSPLLFGTSPGDGTGDNSTD